MSLQLLPKMSLDIDKCPKGARGGVKISLNGGPQLSEREGGFHLQEGREGGTEWVSNQMSFPFIKVLASPETEN